MMLYHVLDSHKNNCAGPVCSSMLYHGPLSSAMRPSDTAPACDFTLGKAYSTKMLKYRLICRPDEQDPLTGGRAQSGPLQRTTPCANVLHTPIARKPLVTSSLTCPGAGKGAALPRNCSPAPSILKTKIHIPATCTCDTSLT